MVYLACGSVTKPILLKPPDCAAAITCATFSYWVVRSARKCNSGCGRDDTGNALSRNLKIIQAKGNRDHGVYRERFTILDMGLEHGALLRRAAATAWY